MLEKLPTHFVVTALLFTCTSPALSQSTPPLPGSEIAQIQTLDTITVTGSRIDNRPVGATQLERQSLAKQRVSTSDTARLLEDIPGVSAYGAGGISSLPVIHGLADDRLRTQVDGMDLMTACPNHMNPALSFIDPNKAASVEVFAGITPVSVGGDSIGGTIQVNSAPPRFAKSDEGVVVEGKAGIFTRSNGNARGSNIGVTLTGRDLNLTFSETNSESDNYWAAGDFKKPGIWQQMGERPVSSREVGSSEYDGSRNRNIGLGLRLLDDHLFKLSVSEQRLDFEGFPNQRMDMVASVTEPSNPGVYVLDKDKPSNVNRVANLHYTGQYEWGELEAHMFRQELTHHMDMLQERFVGMYMPMDTEATTTGGVIKASIELSERDTLRIGSDFQFYRLDDWWPPLGLLPGSMCCNDFWNIRDGERDRVYLYSEWEARWSPELFSQLGIRGGVVKSDAGQVQGYSNTYATDAATFNARDHQRTDNHLDLTALLRYTPDAARSYEAGIARKTRSPNLYERYPWSYNSMAALMNNFVGDGNAYIGNLDLKPEVAHTVSASGDWHDARKEQWNLKLTGYLTYVQDFIDAQRCTPSMNVQCPAANATTTNSYVKLQYVNQSARLYGIDISGQRRLGGFAAVGNFTLTGMASYVRGENRTTGDNLYHMMPLNTKLALVHKLGAWTNTAEVQKVEAKNRVSQVRNEVETPGYTLLNLRTSYEWKHARFDLALENALNTFYLQPLGGAYVGQGNPMTINGIPWGMVVPGKSRSLNIALNVTF